MGRSRDLSALKPPSDSPDSAEGGSGDLQMRIGGHFLIAPATCARRRSITKDDRLETLSRERRLEGAVSVGERHREVHESVDPNLS